MTRRGFIDEQTNTVFFWAQKCGCTSIFEYLSDTYGQPRRFFHRNSGDFAACSQAIAENGYNSVVVKRDPIDRAISCFVDKFVFREEPLLTPSHLASFTQPLYGQYTELFNGETERNTITFEQYLKTVDAAMDARVDPNDNATINGHWDTQVPPAALDFEYDKVFDVSEMSTGFKNYCDEIGIACSGSAENKSTYGESSDEYLGDVPAYELATTLVNKKNFRSPETDRFIRYLYAIDYVKFGDLSW